MPEKSPDDRYQSAEQLAPDLEADLRGERISLGSASMLEGLSRMMRDTHHAHLLSNYESVAILESIILLGTGLAMAYLYHDLGIHVGDLYWSICLSVFLLVAWVAHQFRSPGPFTFMERQLVWVWLGAEMAVWGMLIMEAALGLSIFTLAPAQAVILVLHPSSQPAFSRGDFIYTPAPTFFV